jgi:diguanylate cyclase (GGDEF)-like protein
MRDLQKGRLNLIKDLALGYIVFTIFLFLAYSLELINMKANEFLALLTFIWVGNILYYLIVKTNVNLKLKEPDLFMPMMIWSIFCVIAPTYFMSGTMRAIFVMNYFVVVVFGVFKLNLKQFITLTGFAVSVLGFVIVFYMKKNPSTIHLFNELLLWIIFSVTSISFSLICNNVSNLRQKLKEQKLSLMSAFSDIHKLSITDELTGIYNRRYMMDFMATKKLKVDKGIDDFIACIIDIDFFKKINDTYGHDVGDIVLKKFSNEINKLIRNGDCFARIGGEEFVLIISHVNLETATEVIERIMNKIRNLNFDGYPNLKITISIGMKAYEKGTSIEELLKQIDVLLYKAKNTGRDKFVMD